MWSECTPKGSCVGLGILRWQVLLQAGPMGSPQDWPLPESGFLFGEGIFSSHVFQPSGCHHHPVLVRAGLGTCTVPLNFQNSKLNKLLFFLELLRLRHFIRVQKKTDSKIIRQAEWRLWEWRRNPAPCCGGGVCVFSSLGCILSVVCEDDM